MVTIAIKPGTTYTSIYVSGHGLVLKEPTVAAFVGKDYKRIRAVGYEALAMQGKAPNVTVVTPIAEGILKEPDIFSLMLKEYLAKICPVDAVFKPRYNAIVAIPLGLSVEEREMYEDAVTEAGVSNVTLVPGIVLSAIGADMPVGTGKGMLAVNIGGGRTEVALLAFGGIINGCGIGLGGDTLDKALIDNIMGKYNIKVGSLEARRLREEIGTLYENDVANMTVSGMDIVTNVPETALIYALDVRDVVLPYFMRICDIVKTIIKSCPASIANDLMGGGIALTGGVTNIPGIDRVFVEQLSLPVKTFDKPEYVQIVGAGKLISNDELMTQLIAGGVV